MAPYDPDAYRPPDSIDPPPPEPPKPFLTLLGNAFAFPFTGKGTMMIIAGAGFLAVAGFMVRIASSVPGLIGLFVMACGFVLVLLIAGYLAAYMLKVIGAVCGGDQEPPNWPDFGSYWDDILRPLLLVVGTAALSLAPCIIRYVIVARDVESVGRGAYLWFLVNLLTAEMALADPWFWVLLVLGLLYLPMALLAVALYDSFAGLSPLVVIPAIVRVAPAYSVACGLLLVASAARLCLWRLLSPIPLLGVLLDSTVTLYFLMCEMYILGILYLAYEKKLKWFEG